MLLAAGYFARYVCNTELNKILILKYLLSELYYCLFFLRRRFRIVPVIACTRVLCSPSESGSNVEVTAYPLILSGSLLSCLSLSPNSNSSSHPMKLSGNMKITFAKSSFERFSVSFCLIPTICCSSGEMSITLL